MKNIDPYESTLNKTKKQQLLETEELVATELYNDDDANRIQFDQSGTQYEFSGLNGSN